MEMRADTDPQLETVPEPVDKPLLLPSDLKTLSQEQEQSVNDLNTDKPEALGEETIAIPPPDKTLSDTDSATISNTASSETISDSDTKTEPEPSSKNKSRIEILQVSEDNILIERCSSSEPMDIDEVGEDVALSFTEQGHSSQTTPHLPNHATPVPSSSAKKSNLRKVSKYGASTSISFDYSFSSFNNSFSTPVRRGDDGPTPRKRIRIIEDKNEPESDGDTSVSEDLFGEDVNFDLISGHTFQTNFGGEEMLWVSPPPAPLDFNLIHEGSVRAARCPVTKKFSVELDMHFVDGETVTNLLECKSLMMTAGFFNFEQVCRQVKHCPGKGSALRDKYIYFENASSLQSLDEGLNFDLTFPKELLDKETEVREKNIFYFADIWNTSKGFREYILSKSNCMREGLMMKGFAIQDGDGRRPKDFNPVCGLLFSSFQTPNFIKDSELGEASLPIELVDHFSMEENKDFDITEISVSDEFIKNILSKTDGKGVHLLVADNPPCVTIHEYVREVRFQRKFYAQCIIALLGVREGGSFVVKIHCAITLFTVGLIFLLHRCFKSISIHKPQSSQSHTSERFLICTGKLSNETSEEILQFLLICHNIVMKHEEIRKIIRKKARRRIGIHCFEVKQLVPLSVIIGHADFFEFLRLQNIRFTKSLATSIQELCGSIPENGCFWVLNDPMLVRKNECWMGRVTEKVHEENNPLSIRNAAISLLKNIGFDSDETLPQKDNALNKQLLQEISKSRKGWVVFATQDSKSVISASPISLFVGLGGDTILYSESNPSSLKPIRVEGLSLTKGTVVLGTVVELIPLRPPDKDDDQSQPQIPSIRFEFHIMDGISLSGQNIGDLPFAKRIQLCETYAHVMNKCKDFENLKCTVIKVREPLVLKEQESVLSEWINSRVYTKQDIHHYPGSLRLVNFPEPSSSLAMSVGGLLFYQTDGNMIENIKQRVQWDWKVDKGLSVSVEDFLEM